MLWSGGMRTLACLVLLLGLPGVCAARSDEERFRDSGVAYVDQVHQQLHARWRTFTELLYTLPAGERLREDATLAATVEIALWPDGTIVQVERVAQSGLPGFDEAPTDLLKDLGKLPAPPPALRSDDGRVHLRWRFDRASADADVGLVFDRRLPIEEAVEALIEAGSPERAAARVLEELAEHPADREHLLEVMADAVARRAAAAPEPARRAAAARALAYLDEGEAALRTLAQDPEPAVRTEALEALGRRPPCPKAMALLLQALAGEQAVAAARGLEHLGQGEALASAERERLRAALLDSLRAGRAPAEVVEALRAQGPASAAAALEATRALLSQPAQRLAGIRAAIQLAEPSLEPALLAALPEADADARPLLLVALGRLGARLQPAGRAAVLRALSDESPAVRAEAVRAVGGIGERRYQSRLVDALGDAEAPVRAAAVTALVEVAGERAVDELFRPLRDSAPSVRAALAAALVEHNLAGTQSYLRRLRGDCCPLVQAAARGADSEAPAPPVDERLLATRSDAARELDRTRAAAEWLARGDAPATDEAAPDGAGPIVVSILAR